MTDTISLTGIVATEPRHIVTGEGLAITNFRLASTQRRFDKAHERWVDAETNWYTVTSFRQLAINVSGSLKKGERVVVTGRVRIREWDNGERKGMTIDVEADAIGHDLAWGTTAFTRSITSSAASASAPDSFPSEHDTSAADESSPEVTIEPQPLAAQFAEALPAAQLQPEPEPATPF